MSATTLQNDVFGAAWQVAYTSAPSADTHIVLNGGDEIILQNVLATALHQDDFIF